MLVQNSDFQVIVQMSQNSILIKKMISNSIYQNSPGLISFMYYKLMSHLSHLKKNKDIHDL